MSPSPSLCSLWSAAKPCTEPYHSCYPVTGQRFYAVVEGVCSCSSFYGYRDVAQGDLFVALEAQSSNQYSNYSTFEPVSWGKEQCTVAAWETTIVVLVSAACIILFAIAMKGNMRTLRALQEADTEHSKASATSAKIKSANQPKGGGIALGGVGVARDSSQPIHHKGKDRGPMVRKAITLFNLCGCILGLLSELCFVLTAAGVDNDFVLHIYIRPYLYAFNGGAMMLSDALIFLTWKEIYMRSGKVMNKQAINLPQIPLWARTILFLFAVGLAAGYAIAHGLGFSLISEGIACFAMLVIATAMIPAGNFVAFQLLSSSSPSVNHAGKEVKALSRRLVLIHAAFVVSDILYLSTLKVQGASIAPLIFAICAEAQLALIRSAIGTYIAGLIKSLSNNHYLTRSDHHSTVVEVDAHN